MIPKHLTALANHKGAAILHAGGMLIPVKIMDIEHEESIYEGSKTTFKGQEGDVYSPETGLFTCIAKKRLGNKGNFNDVFKKHIPSY